MSNELKKSIIKLLKEDEDFRYTVAGLIGYDAILKRFDEHDKKFNEILQEIAMLREEQNRLRQDMKDEFAKVWDEITKLRQDMKDEFAKVWDEITKLRNTINAIGARWGIMAEDAFREGIKAVLEKELEGYKVERWSYYDKEGYVYGEPNSIELDVAVSNGKVILMEIKSNINRNDAYLFKKKVELYRKVTGKSVDRKVIVTPFIDIYGKEYCNKHGIEVYTSEYIRPFVY